MSLAAATGLSAQSFSQQEQEREQILSRLKAKSNAVKAARSNPTLWTTALKLVAKDIFMDQCFDTVVDVHKQLKTGKYCLNCNIGTDLIDEPGFDVFGQSIGSIPSENVRCSHCDRLVMASRYAPHLEKCLGMGRTSVRAVARQARQAEGATPDFGRHLLQPTGATAATTKRTPDTALDKPGLAAAAAALDDDFDAKGITDVSRRKRKRHRRQHAIASLRRQSAQQLRTLLETTCGVVSGNTGKMCTKSLKCPQHSETQRINVRRLLLSAPDAVVNASAPPATIVQSEPNAVDVFMPS